MNTRDSFKDEVKLSFRLFLPLFFSHLVYAISVFVGTILIAHIDKELLAGLALGMVTFTTLCTFFLGFFIGISMIIAYYIGAKEEERIGCVISQGFILAILCSMIFCTILYYIPICFSYLKQQENTITISVTYLKALSFSILPWLGTIVLEQFLIGLTLTRLVLIISIIQVPCEILISYILIFGKFGLPQFGIAGLGYGFAITSYFSLIIVLIFICKYPKTKKYNILRNFLSPNLILLKKFFLIGLPISIINLMENLFFFTLTIIIGLLGTDELASQQIIKQYIELALCISLAITQVASVRVNNFIGAKNVYGINTTIKVNISIVFFTMLIIGIIYTFATDYLISIDIDINIPENLNILNFTRKLFFIAALFQIFDGIRLVSMSILRSLNDYKVPVYIVIVTFWIISMLSVYILGFKLKMGIIGIWSGVLISTIIGTLFTLLRLKFIYNQHQPNIRSVIKNNQY